MHRHDNEARDTGKPIVQDAERPDRRLAQPFSGWTHEQMTASIETFIEESELQDWSDYIRRGAFLAQSKAAFAPGRERRDGLTLKDSERAYIDLENSPRRIDKFKQPWRLYALVGCCSLGAAVQGWYVNHRPTKETRSLLLTDSRDETAINGGRSRGTYTHSQVDVPFSSDILSTGF